MIFHDSTGVQIYTAVYQNQCRHCKNLIQKLCYDLLNNVINFLNIIAAYSKFLEEVKRIYLMWSMLNKFFIDCLVETVKLVGRKFKAEPAIPGPFM